MGSCFSLKGGFFFSLQTLFNVYIQPFSYERPASINFVLVRGASLHLRLGLDLHLSATSSVLYTFLWVYNPFFSPIVLYLAVLLYVRPLGSPAFLALSCISLDLTA